MTVSAPSASQWQMATQGSARLFERAQAVLPGGVNSPVRGTSCWRPVPGLPRARQTARTCTTWTATSTSTWSWASGPSSSATTTRPSRRRSPSRPAAAGLRHLHARSRSRSRSGSWPMVPALEQVRFTSSGTESTMHALRLARGFTGKPKILKFEGHFHGNHDQVLVSVTPPLSSVGSEADPLRIPVGSGIPAEHYEHTLVAVWNDLEAIERVISRHRDELAAVIVEPVMANKGFIGPRARLPRGPARDHARERRAAHHGRGHHRLPLRARRCAGLLGHRARPLDLRQGHGQRRQHRRLRWPARHHVAAGHGRGPPRRARTTPRSCRSPRRGPRSPSSTRDEGAVYVRLAALGERLIDGLREAIAATGAPAIVQGHASMLQLYFTEREASAPTARRRTSTTSASWPSPTRSVRRGVLVHPDPFEHWFLSAAHTEADIDQVVEAAEDSLRAVLAA